MDNSQNIIKELGLDSLTPEKQEEVVLRIGNIINQRVLIRALDEMSDSGKQEFEEFLGDEKNDQSASFDFLRSKIKNFDDIVNEEIIKFKKSSIDFLNHVKK